jgi:predicted GIY-YIG superfamily endonuclease
MSNYHVYILSFKGDIFYIGISNQLEWRIQRHHSDKFESNYDHIRLIESKGDSITLEVIGEFEQKSHAEFMEYSIIIYNALIGNKLFNKKYNPIYNRRETIKYDGLPIKRKKKGFIKYKVTQALENFKKIQNDIKKT